MYRRTAIKKVGISEGDRLCGLVVRVPSYCVSCEVRTEFMYVM
jgi:hypothetical protein